jgi:murein DD-endopeptidase MepM/ murein hydrolase activator NlpD
MIKKIFLCCLLLFCLNTSSYSIEFFGKFTEGGIVKGKVSPNSELFLDKKKLTISRNGYFIFGIEKGRTKNIAIKIITNGESQVFSKKVKKRVFLTQKINGLPKKMVTPGKKALERIRKEQIFFNQMRSIDSNNEFFYSKFLKPATGIISGKYGSQRVLNGKPRRPQMGLDIANKKGTSIQATAEGVVTLAQKNLYFTGGTIGIDHGHGITSVYYHLNSLNVKKGQKVLQGDVIGTMGSTGRSTGDHLHFGIYWKQIALDPELALKN